MDINLVKGRANYKIEVDKYQYILKKWRTPSKLRRNGKKKDPYWEVLGYYTSIQEVSKRLLHEGIVKLEEQKSLEETVKNAQKWLEKLIENGDFLHKAE